MGHRWSADQQAASGQGRRWLEQKQAPVAGTAETGRRVRQRWTGAPVAWGAGGEAWTLVAQTMDAGGMENGGRRKCIVPKKKAKSCACA